MQLKFEVDFSILSCNSFGFLVYIYSLYFSLYFEQQDSKQLVGGYAVDRFCGGCSVGGWVSGLCLLVIIRLAQFQLLLQLPTWTELGNSISLFILEKLNTLMKNMNYKYNH